MHIGKKSTSLTKKYPPGSFMGRLRERKIIATLAAFIGGGWLSYEVVHWVLVDHYQLPKILKDITLVTFLGALFSTLLWQWFQGAKKRPGNVRVEVLVVPLIILFTVVIDLKFVFKMIGSSMNMLLIGIVALCLGIAWVVFKSIQWAVSVPEAEKEVEALKQIEEKPISLSEWKNSIAVLPFSDLSPQRDQEYFCDGLAEELINSLTKVEDLRTVARTSAFAFKGKNIDIREIGKKLNVNEVLEGSVRKEKNRLRITAQLVNVVDGYHLWSERYDRELEDVFAIQDEIASNIIGKLKMKLALPDKAYKERHTKNLEAYDAYLRGRHCLSKFTGRWVKCAIDYFKEAIDKDADYAPAYAALAESYQRYSSLGVLASKEAILKVQEAAQQALQLDPSLAEAHFALAMIAAFHEWDRTAAEERFKRALELNPNFAKAHSWYAIFLMSYDRKYEEALDLISRAEELDPLELQVKTHRGWVYCFQRRFDEAVTLFQNLINLEPYFALGHYWLGCSYTYKGLYDEAVEELEKAIELGGRSVFQLSMLGFTLARAGNKAKAKEVLNELERRSKEGSGFSWVARVYTALGETDKVFEWLEKAYKQRDPSLTYIADSLEFEDVRSDPRFKTFLKKMGLG